MVGLVIGNEYLHLYWSGASRTSQGIVILGSCQKALLGISSSVGVLCLHMRWIPKWRGHWVAFSSFSVPYFVPVFPLGRNNSGLKFWRWMDGPIPQLGAMPNLWIRSLQVLSPFCWVFPCQTFPCWGLDAFGDWYGAYSLQLLVGSCKL